MYGPMMEVLFAGKWRRARFDGASIIITVPENSAVFVGVRIGLAAIERRLKNGTARILPAPAPPKISVNDPVVAEMFWKSHIEYARR